MILFANIEDRANIWMVQRRRRPRLLQETLSHPWHRVVVMKQLYRHFALKTFVPRPEDEAHAAAA